MGISFILLETALRCNKSNTKLWWGTEEYIHFGRYEFLDEVHLSEKLFETDLCKKSQKIWISGDLYETFFYL